MKSATLRRLAKWTLAMSASVPAVALLARAQGGPLGEEVQPPANTLTARTAPLRVRGVSTLAASAYQGWRGRDPALFTLGSARTTDAQGGTGTLEQVCAGARTCTGDVTTARCTDVCWLQACPARHAACVLHLRGNTLAELDAVQSSARTPSLLVPARFENAGQRKTTKRFFWEGAGGVELTGLGATLEGRAHMQQHAAMPRTGGAVKAVADARKASLDQARAAWRGRNAVRTCEEFAWKKYYSFSAFEDAMAQVGGDPRAVFGLVYGTPANGVDKFDLPANRFVTDFERTASGGNAPARTQYRGADVPFEIPDTATDSKNAFVAAREALVPPNAGARFTFKLPELYFSQYFQVHEFALDTFRPRGGGAFAPNTPKSTSYAGHRALSTELAAAGWHDDELQLRFEKQVELERLLAKRQALLDAWWRHVVSECRKIVPHPGYGEAAYHHWWCREERPSSGQWICNGPAKETDAWIDRVTRREFRDPGPPISVRFDTIQSTPYHADGCWQGKGSAAGANATTGDNMLAERAAAEPYYNKIKRIDERLDELFKEARDLGCFDAGRTGCDWSPGYFVQELKKDSARSKVLAAREASFQECNKLTYPAGEGYTYPATEGADIQFNKGVGAVALGKRPCGTTFCDSISTAAGDDAKRAENWAAFKGSVRKLEAFFAAARAHFAQAQRDADLTKVEARAAASGGSGRTLGDLSSDGGRVGDDTFGGSYSLDASWKATGFGATDANAVNTRLDTAAALDAYVTVLGWTKSIAHFDPRVAADRGTGNRPRFRTHLDLPTVLGLSVWGGSNGANDSGATNAPYNFTRHPFEEQGTPKLGTTIVVAGVPVILRAYAVGRLGVDIGVQGNGELDPNSVATLVSRLSGEVQPYAMVDATGEVAVGVDGLAEAGLRGKLRLIRVDLPFNVKADLKFVPAKTSVRLYARQTLDLKVTTLDGKLSVYVALAGEDVGEKDIFQWNGRSSATRLMTKDYDVGLGAARGVLDTSRSSW